jgi:hypothetical protein
MTYSLGGVALPYGLLWTDEQAWTPYVQAQEYSLTGALILQYGTKQAGRPITLSGTDQRAWVTQDTLDDLRALLGIEAMALVLPDVRTFSVTWNHNGPPIVATPILDRWPHAGQKYSAVTLALIEV